MQLTGRVFINVKGKRLRSKEGSTLKFSDVSREGVAADTGVAGYVEKTEIPGCECTIAHAGDTSLAEFLAITNETISFETDSGKSYVLSEAWCHGGIELSKGEVKLAFSAMKCEEV